jgi:hypothetical protein
VIVDSGEVGIHYQSGGAITIYHNTLVNNKQTGMLIESGLTGEIFDNIVVGSPTLIQAGSMKVGNNYTASVATVTNSCDMRRDGFAGCLHLLDEGVLHPIR